MVNCVNVTCKRNTCHKLVEFSVLNQFNGLSQIVQKLKCIFISMYLFGYRLTVALLGSLHTPKDHDNEGGLKTISETRLGRLYSTYTSEIYTVYSCPRLLSSSSKSSMNSGSGDTRPGIPRPEK